MQEQIDLKFKLKNFEICQLMIVISGNRICEQDVRECPIANKCFLWVNKMQLFAEIRNNIDSGVKILLTLVKGAFRYNELNILQVRTIRSWLK